VLDDANVVGDSWIALATNQKEELVGRNHWLICSPYTKSISALDSWNTIAGSGRKHYTRRKIRTPVSS